MKRLVFKKGLVVALAILGITLAPGITPKVSAASPSVGSDAWNMPCSYAGSGHYNCQWYLPGNGITGGTPVKQSMGDLSKRVGYLHKGTNWITCQSYGPLMFYGGHWTSIWGHTVADNGKSGWVSGVFAKGGRDGGAFTSNVPMCSHGAS